MILVDTSIWVDHLRAGSAALTALLRDSSVLSHPWIVGELALGQLRQRSEVIGLLRSLPQAETASSDEVLRLIEQEKLHGAGIGYVDAQLVAATKLTRDTALWTKDKRLHGVAERLGVAFRPAQR